MLHECPSTTMLPDEPSPRDLRTRWFSMREKSFAKEKCEGLCPPGVGPCGHGEARSICSPHGRAQKRFAKLAWLLSRFVSGVAGVKVG